MHVLKFDYFVISDDVSAILIFVSEFIVTMVISSTIYIFKRYVASWLPVYVNTSRIMFLQS